MWLYVVCVCACLMYLSVGCLVVNSKKMRVGLCFCLIGYHNLRTSTMLSELRRETREMAAQPEGGRETGCFQRQQEKIGIILTNLHVH